MMLTKRAAKAVQEYFASVSRCLGDVPKAERQEILRDLKSHIAEALKARAATDPVDVDVVRAVLAEMDPPQSYAQPAAVLSDAPVARPAGPATVYPVKPARQNWPLYSLLGAAALMLIAGAVVAGFLLWPGGKAGAGGPAADAPPAGDWAIRQSTPQELVETDFAIRKRWDLAAAVLIIHPDWQEPMRVSLRFLEKAYKLNDACKELANAVQKAYGKPIADALRLNLNKTPSTPPIKEMMQKEIAQVYVDGKVDWKKVKVSVRGDRGQVTWPGQDGGPMQIVKAGDKWYELPEEAAQISPQQMLATFRQMEDEFDGVFAELEGLTGKVRSGKLSLEEYRRISGAWGAKMIAMGLKWQGGGEPPEAVAAKKQPVSPPPPKKPQVSDFKSALEALKSKDVFLRREGFAWVAKNKITSVEDNDALCAVAIERMNTTDAFLRRDFLGLLCEHAGAHQIPFLVKTAESAQDADVWRPMLAALFRLSPEEGRKIVAHRATAGDVRGFAMDTFRKDPPRYAAHATLLFKETTNPDLQRDLVNLLKQIGDESCLEPLRQYKAGLGNNIEYRDQIGQVDDALATIRQRLVDQGRQIPPEPRTDLTKLGFPDADAALRSLRSTNYHVKQAAIKWFEDNKLEKPEHIQKLVEEANDLRKTAGFPDGGRYTALFARYAEKDHLDELVALAKEKDGVAAAAAIGAVFRLAPETGHTILVSRAGEPFFPTRAFVELQKDPANENAVILLLRAEPLEDLAIRTLEAMGTVKSIRPLEQLKAALMARKGKDFHTNVRIDRKAKAIDNAIAAVRARASGPKPRASTGR